MKIPFVQISSTGSRYTLSNLKLSCDGKDFEVQGPVELSCTLQRKRKNRIVLQGKVLASLRLNCNRCLAGYPFKVHSNMHLIYELVDTEHWQIKEIDLSAVDLDIVKLAEPVIDLEDVARQQLYMALPVIQVCTKECKGICPGCGNNLNDSPCSCTVSEKSSPFAVLAALKK